MLHVAELVGDDRRDLVGAVRLLAGGRPACRPGRPAARAHWRCRTTAACASVGRSSAPASLILSTSAGERRLAFGAGAELAAEQRADLAVRGVAHALLPAHGHDRRDPVRRIGNAEHRQPDDRAQRSERPEHDRAACCRGLRSTMSIAAQCERIAALVAWSAISSRASGSAVTQASRSRFGRSVGAAHLAERPDVEDAACLRRSRGRRRSAASPAACGWSCRRNRPQPRGCLTAAGGGTVVGTAGLLAFRQATRPSEARRYRDCRRGPRRAHCTVWPLLRDIDRRSEIEHRGRIRHATPDVVDQIHAHHGPECRGCRPDSRRRCRPGWPDAAWPAPRSSGPDAASPNMA